MVLIKKEVIMPFPKGKKPNRFRFKGDLRLGFRGREVVEVVRFKRTRSKKK